MKCEACGATFRSNGDVCDSCFDTWLESPAYARGTHQDSDTDNLDRQYVDWLSTKKLEKLNGAK